MSDRKIFKKQSKRGTIKGASKGPLARQRGKGSINKADITRNWTPAQKVILTLVIAGFYAGIMVTIYLTGAKAVAIMFGGVTMVICLIAILMYWAFKG